jgi:hypothetical protein
MRFTNVRVAVVAIAGLGISVAEFMRASESRDYIDRFGSALGIAGFALLGCLVALKISSQRQ